MTVSRSTIVPALYVLQTHRLPQCHNPVHSGTTLALIGALALADGAVAHRLLG